MTSIKILYHEPYDIFNELCFCARTKTYFIKKKHHKGYSIHPAGKDRAEAYMQLHVEHHIECEDEKIRRSLYVKEAWEV